MFRLKQGVTKNEWFPVTTSTAIPAGSLVTPSTGLLIAATSSTAAADIMGVLQKTLASGDFDYATARTVPVQVPIERHVVYEFDVTSGLVAADFGKEVDLTDAATVNRGATSIKAVRITKVVTSTLGQGYVKFNGSY